MVFFFIKRLFCFSCVISNILGFPEKKKLHSGWSWKYDIQSDFISGKTTVLASLAEPCQGRFQLLSARCVTSFQTVLFSAAHSTTSGTVFIIQAFCCLCWWWWSMNLTPRVSDQDNPELVAEMRWKLIFMFTKGAEFLYPFSEDDKEFCTSLVAAALGHLKYGRCCVTTCCYGNIKYGPAIGTSSHIMTGLCKWLDSSEQQNRATSKQ